MLLLAWTELILVFKNPLTYNINKKWIKASKNNFSLHTKSSVLATAYRLYGTEGFKKKSFPRNKT